MNVLFLTISRFRGIEERGIYTDLMRKFHSEGHRVYIASPVERRFGQSTALSSRDGVTHLRIKTLNNQKTHFIEKGISTLIIGRQFKRNIIKYLGDVDFDLILYSTPPITFTSAIRKLKRRGSAVSYLLLKDIFPQNAVDLGMMGTKSPLYHYFRRKERKLYAVSDFIGCMSPANVEYLLHHNPDVDPERVEVCPNSIEPLPREKYRVEDERNAVRTKYGIPKDATVFLYGGNLGKPQGVDFLLSVLESNAYRPDRFFLIAGAGTEYKRMRAWFDERNIDNALLLTALPKNDYDMLTRACDVGMIFLDRRFTIPNYPSRLLSYLENEMPVLSATDTNTDVGSVSHDNGYGFWCESGDLRGFNDFVERLSGDRELIKSMGDRGYDYLIENFTTDKSYDIIMRRVNRKA